MRQPYLIVKIQVKNTWAFTDLKTGARLYPLGKLKEAGTYWLRKKISDVFTTKKSTKTMKTAQDFRYEHGKPEHNASEKAGICMYTAQEVERLMEEYASQSKVVEIDFCGHVRARIEFSDNSIKVIAAMNGYGDAIDCEKILINREPNNQNPMKQGYSFIIFPLLCFLKHQDGSKEITFGWLSHTWSFVWNKGNGENL